MHINNHIASAKSLTFLLENRFRIFGFRFGLDPLLGLAPWVGDVISAVLALYIVWLGMRVGVPQKHIDRMVRNIIFDLIIGIIPVVGTVGDFIFRSNSRNLDIVLKHYNRAVEGEFVEIRTVST
jgi:hypothetical protein